MSRTCPRISDRILIVPKAQRLREEKDHAKQDLCEVSGLQDRFNLQGPTTHRSVRPVFALSCALSPDSPNCASGLRLDLKLKQLEEKEKEAAPVSLLPPSALLEPPESLSSSRQTLL